MCPWVNILPVMWVCVHGGWVISEFYVLVCVCAFTGEESLMIFVDKRKLSRTSEVTESNGTAVTLEALHQLAASYFIDRESTLHKLHHIQIASTAIKVNARCSLGFCQTQ